MLVSNALLVNSQRHNERFWSSRHEKINLSSHFFDLDIENPLGRGTLAKFRSSLYYRIIILGIHFSKGYNFGPSVAHEIQLSEMKGLDAVFKPKNQQFF
jgi:hypothetical protein